ncbi:DUF3397 domain-containing protein [Enterococcus lemanii]|uniref:DUF3397 domain-containing protein n=1 Tax=Enterococcus lemanii TaxID=1159752 RepID=A0ABV9MX30_9ENTE|nr:DUF3397 domain-containing protein [Enterococcus lemanii]
MQSMFPSLIFWYVFPLVVIFLMRLLVSLSSLDRRFSIKTPDLAVPFLLFGIHRLSFLIFKESLFPYLVITLSLLGIGIAFFQAYFYEEIEFPRFFKMYWRSVFLFALVVHVSLIVLSLILLSVS